MYAPAFCSEPPLAIVPLQVGQPAVLDAFRGVVHLAGPAASVPAVEQKPKRKGEFPFHVA